MATATGTADNYLDVLTKLRDFLVSTGSWSVVGGKATGAFVNDTEFVSLKGTGLTGTDAIYITLQPFSAPANNAYSIRVKGHTAYVNPGIVQPGSDSRWCYLLMLNSPMTYWFVANGRRFIAAIKSGSRYDAMYAGFILPEHLPNDWSYPLFIGASSYTGSQSQATDDLVHSNFWNPIATGSSNNEASGSVLFSPMQQWILVRNGYPSSGSVSVTETGRFTIPWSLTCLQNLRPQLDGQVWLKRGQLVCCDRTYSSVDNNVPEGGMFYGSFDGVFYAPAFGSTAEQEVTYSGVTYKMFPNVGRTSDGQFAAIAME